MKYIYMCFKIQTIKSYLSMTFLLSILVILSNLYSLEWFSVYAQNSEDILQELFGNITTDTTPLSNQTLLNTTTTDTTPLSNQTLLNTTTTDTTPLS